MWISQHFFPDASCIADDHMVLQVPLHEDPRCTSAETDLNLPIANGITQHACDSPAGLLVAASEGRPPGMELLPRSAPCEGLVAARDHIAQDDGICCMGGKMPPLTEAGCPSELSKDQQYHPRQGW